MPFTRVIRRGCASRQWPLPESASLISLDDCIRAYTAGSAYAEFEEGKKGQIAPGQWADIIVLSTDLTKLAPQNWPH